MEEKNTATKAHATAIALSAVSFPCWFISPGAGGKFNLVPPATSSGRGISSPFPSLPKINGGRLTRTTPIRQKKPASNSRWESVSCRNKKLRRVVTLGARNWIVTESESVRPLRLW